MANPYLPQQAEAITNQVKQNFLQNTLPGINMGSMMAGGYGGSSQALAQGVAAGNAATGLSNALANLYGNAYQQDQSLDLGRTQANQNFYTAQRGQDLQSLGLGASLAGVANQGFLGQGQGLYNIGTTQQQAPWQQLQNFTNTLSPFAGFGQTQTQNTPGGSSIGGAIGGALSAAQLWKLLSGS